MHYYKTTTGQYFGAYKYEQCDDRLIEISKQEYNKLKNVLVQENV